MERNETKKIVSKGNDAAIVKTMSRQECVNGVVRVIIVLYLPRTKHRTAQDAKRRRYAAEMKKVMEVDKHAVARIFDVDNCPTVFASME